MTYVVTVGISSVMNVRGKTLLAKCVLVSEAVKRNKCFQRFRMLSGSLKWPCY